MKVKDIIEQLKPFDPEMEIGIGELEPISAIANIGALSLYIDVEIGEYRGNVIVVWTMENCARLKEMGMVFNMLNREEIDGPTEQH